MFIVKSLKLFYSLKLGFFSFFHLEGGRIIMMMMLKSINHQKANTELMRVVLYIITIYMESKLKLKKFKITRIKNKIKKYILRYVYYKQFQLHIF